MTLVYIKVPAQENSKLPKEFKCLFQPTFEDGAPVFQFLLEGRNIISINVS